MEPRAPESLAARGGGDHRLRLHDELGAVAPCRPAGGSVARRLSIRVMYGLSTTLMTPQPLDVDVARPARNDQPQGSHSPAARPRRSVRRRPARRPSPLPSACCARSRCHPRPRRGPSRLLSARRPRAARARAAPRSTHCSSWRRECPGHSSPRARAIRAASCPGTRGRGCARLTAGADFLDVRINGRSTIPWIRRRCLAGSMSGTPPRWTSKWSDEGVMIPSVSSSGVRVLAAISSVFDLANLVPGHLLEARALTIGPNGSAEHLRWIVGCG